MVKNFSLQSCRFLLPLLFCLLQGSLISCILLNIRLKLLIHPLNRTLNLPFLELAFPEQRSQFIPFNTRGPQGITPLLSLFINLLQPYNLSLVTRTDLLHPFQHTLSKGIVMQIPYIIV